MSILYPSEVFVKMVTCKISAATDRNFLLLSKSSIEYSKYRFLEQNSCCTNDKAHAMPTDLHVEGTYNEIGAWQVCHWA